MEWHLQKSDDASNRDEAAADIRLRWRFDSEGTVHGPTAWVDMQRDTAMGSARAVDFYIFGHVPVVTQVALTELAYLLAGVSMRSR